MALGEWCVKHEMSSCAECNRELMPPKPKHAKTGFPAQFGDSWCDAGDDAINEGDMITKHDDWRGYVHVSCL